MLARGHTYLLAAVLVLAVPGLAEPWATPADDRMEGSAPAEGPMPTPNQVETWARDPATRLPPGLDVSNLGWVEGGPPPVGDVLELATSMPLADAADPKAHPRLPAVVAHLMQLVGEPTQGPEKVDDVAEQLEPPVRSALAALLEAYADHLERLRTHEPVAVDPIDRLSPELKDSLEPAIPADGTAGLPNPAVIASQKRLLDHAFTLQQQLQEVDDDGPVLDLRPVLLVERSGNDNTYEGDVRVLVDDGGDDRYLNNAGGAGPGEAALMLDTAGNDTYGEPKAEPNNRSRAVVNGAATGGTGLLVDGNGTDTYAGRANANGAGALGGLGTLVDLAGSDTYDAELGSHGYGAAGVGVLVDRGGDEDYRLGASSGNGGAILGGIGVLMDTAGNESYRSAMELPRTEAGTASNGGSYLGGLGLLVDQEGSDTYRAGAYGNNGGGYAGGLGVLIDENGDDQYWTRSVKQGATGLISGGTNGGGGYLGGSGLLVDADGNDHYRSNSFGSNGGAYSTPSNGRLLDLAGDDLYNAEEFYGNGGASGGVPLVPYAPASGLLYDGSGRDVYDPPVEGTEVDETIVPKGLAGAQVDANHTKSRALGAGGSILNLS